MFVRVCVCVVWWCVCDQEGRQCSAMFWPNFSLEAHGGLTHEDRTSLPPPCAHTHHTHTHSRTHSHHTHTHTRHTHTHTLTHHTHSLHTKAGGSRCRLIAMTSGFFDWCLLALPWLALPWRLGCLGFWQGGKGTGLEIRLDGANQSLTASIEPSFMTRCNQKQSDDCVCADEAEHQTDRQNV